jgi:hypothetical protein
MSWVALVVNNIVYNNFLKMAHRCRNMYEFIYVVCIVSGSTFVELHIDYRYLHSMNNIKCGGYVKYSVRTDVMYLVVQSYSENILSPC